MKFLADRLKNLIPQGKAKGIAEAAGVSAATLSQYASGERENPDSVVLAKVAKELGVSMDYFFGLEPATTTDALRESPAEHLIDDVIAEAQEIRERAGRLEMMAKKLKSGRSVPAPISEDEFLRRAVSGSERDPIAYGRKKK